MTTILLPVERIECLFVSEDPFFEKLKDGRRADKDQKLKLSLCAGSG